MTNEELKACREAFENLLRFAERQVCEHTETHRRGIVWEECNQCGCRWADDEGGKPEFVEPKEITDAREALAELTRAQSAVDLEALKREAIRWKIKRRKETRTHTLCDFVDHLAAQGHIAQTFYWNGNKWVTAAAFTKLPEPFVTEPEPQPSCDAKAEALKLFDELCFGTTYDPNWTEDQTRQHVEKIREFLATPNPPISAAINELLESMKLDENKIKKSSIVTEVFGEKSLDIDKIVKMQQLQIRSRNLALQNAQKLIAEKLEKMGVE